MPDIDKELLARALEKQGSKDYNDWLYQEGDGTKTFSDAGTPPPSATPEPVGYSTAERPAPEPTREATPPTGSLMEDDLRLRPPEAPMSKASDAPVEPPAPVAETPAAPRRRKSDAVAPAPAPAAVAPPAPGETPTDAQLLSPGAPDAPPPPPVTSQNDGVEDLGFDPSKGTRQLRGEVAAGTDRAIGLAGEAAGAAEARGAKEREIEAARSETGATAIEDGRARLAEQTARSEQNRNDQRDEMAEMKRQIANPPFDTVGLVFGLVSALAASQGKGAAAQAFTQLGQAVNHRMQKYKGSIEAGETNLEGLGKIATADRIAALDENQGADLLNKATAAEFSLALDHVKAQAKTEDEVRAATILENQLAMAAKGGELKKREAAAKAEQLRVINAKLARASSEAERTQIANDLGPDARKLYGQMLKQSKDQASVGGEMLGNELKTAQIGKTQAEARKLDAAAKAGPEVEWAPKGWQAPPGVTPQISARIAGLAEKKGQVAAYYNRLMEISEAVSDGKISKTDGNVLQEIEDIRNGLVSMKTTFTGAGAPTGAEYDQTIATIADPQKLFQRGDSYTKLVRARTNLENSYGSALKEVGYSKGDATRPAAAPGRGAGGGVVEVIDPNGERVKMPASAAEALVKQYGYTMPEDEPAP